MQFAEADTGYATDAAPIAVNETVVVTADRLQLLAQYEDAAYPQPFSRNGGWLTYTPVEGDSSGGRWLAVGGKTLNIYVNNSNVLGLHGWEGNYQAYALDEYGNIIPNMCAQSCATSIGSHMLPMSSYTFSYQANFFSPSGLYLWDVNLSEAVNPTADNQIDFQFIVSVASGGHK
jgi:hypothetical protein